MLIRCGSKSGLVTDGEHLPVTALVFVQFRGGVGTSKFSSPLFSTIGMVLIESRSSGIAI